MALYIFSLIITYYTQLLEAIDARTDNAVNKLCHIVEVTYDLYQEYPAEIRLTLLSQYQFWDKIAEHIKPHFIMRKILNEGMDRGQIPRRDVYLWISIFSGLMLQPLAQYPYFHDVLPELPVLKHEVRSLVYKLFSQGDH